MLTSLTLALAAAGPLPSDDWAGFRGPNGSGVAQGALPTTFGEEAPIVWEADLPSGYSSPAVHNGRVWVTGADKTHLFTVCLDEATGERLWHRRLDYDGKRPGGNSSAAPTPAVDGERVYALFHHVGLVAYDHYGEEVWRNALGAPFNIPHGLATSPVLHDGSVLLQLDQDQGSALVCLDAATGEERWRVARDGAVHSYSTPAIHSPEGGRAVAVVNGSYEVVAYDLASGERVWWVGGGAWQSKAVPVFHGDLCIISSYMPLASELKLPPIPSTFEAALEQMDADGSGRISRDEWEHEMMQQTWFIWDRNSDDELDADDFAYLMSTKTAQGALFGIRLGGAGDVSETHVAWKYERRRGLSDVTSPVVVDGRVYLIKEGGVMTVFDATTGEVLGDGRVGEPDQYFASPVAAGGHLLTTGLSGQLAVVEANADCKTVATTSLDLGRCWSTPALTEGRILVRGVQKLVCLERP